MPFVLGTLAVVLVHARRRVLFLALLFLVVAGAVGGGVADRLTTGGFDDPASDSFRAAEALDRGFGVGAPNLVLLVQAPDGVDAAEAVAAGEDLTRRLAAEPGVTGRCRGTSRARTRRPRPDGRGRSGGTSPRRTA